MARFKFTVEVPLFCVYFSFMMISGVIVNLNLYKTCYTLMDYPEEDCARLGRYTDNDTKALEDKVQAKASFVTVITEMVPGSLPVVLSLIIGSCSDKFGRKPIMVLVLTCLTIGFVVSSLLLLIQNINPYELMVAGIPVMLCGGPMTFFSVTLAYLNDISTEETRGLRMAAFEVIMVFCSCFATLLSTNLLYATSYAAVYGLAGGLVGIATIYTIFLIPESLESKSEEKPTFSNIFTCDNLTGMFRAMGKQRPDGKRSIFLLLLLINTIVNFVTLGEGNIKTLYLRKVLDWTMGDKNIFTSWSSVCGIIGTIVFTLLLHQKLKIRELILVLLGIVSSVGVSVLYALANNNGYIYGTVPVGLLGGLIGPMLRTKIGQTIASDELGKIFALITIINSIFQLVSGLLYSFVYQKTLDTHPEAFNWFSIGLMEFCMILVVIIMVIEKRHPPQPSSKEKETLTNVQKSAEESH